MSVARRRALLSVTDKTGIVELGQALAERGFSVLSSGGTARALREAGVEVEDVATYTGSPEILGGRVKTLHPRVHGGILARAGHEGDAAQLVEHGIDAIDVVVVNLYRFEEAVQDFQGRSGLSLDDPAVREVIEQIDIGGPTLLRAAAKNAERVAVVVDPSDYPVLLRQLDSADPGGGGLDAGFRATLAAKAFRRVFEYDRAIDAFFQQGFADAAMAPSAEQLVSGRVQDEQAESHPHALRYGENPHQRAFFVRGEDPGEAGVLHARSLSGKALSYNNLLDAEAALELVKEFEGPAAVVVKHANPCGAAVAETPMQAFEAAYAGDPLSAFGGILALNRPVDLELARRIAVREHFFEVLVAPEIPEDVLEVLRTGAPWGKNLRVLACGPTDRRAASGPRYSVRSLVGGVLVQERDLDSGGQREVKSRRAPTGPESRDLELAWRIVKHVHSNAIVLVKDGALVGTGAGQMSRVDSVRIAVEKAGEDRAKGAVMGSDAFFPFRDGVDLGLQAGVSAVIQPGGSRRDAETIEACDEKGAALVFTGQRHFLH